MYHDCDEKGHQVLDEQVRIIRNKGDYIQAEVYCKHCDHWAKGNYHLDTKNIMWRDDY